MIFLVSFAHAHKRCYTDEVLMKMQLFEIISILGIVQGFLLVVLLFFRKKNKTANYFLMSLLSLTSLILLYNLCFRNGILVADLSLQVFINNCIFLLPALHFYYAISLLNPKGKIKIYKLGQLSIFIIINVLCIPVYLKNKEALEIYNSIRNNNSFYLASSLYSIVVMVLVLRLLKAHLQNIKTNFSSIEKISLNWLRVITLILLVFDVLFIILLYLPVFISIELTIPSLILNILVVVLIYVTAIFGFRQPEIFMEYSPSDHSDKYKTSGLTAVKSLEIELKLLNVLDKEKPYLNENLTIHELSVLIDVTPAYLSQVINERIKMNFYTLINKYRIEEAMRLINQSNYSSLKIEAIAWDVGFKSKSTFNAAFKKQTGMTPSLFRNQQS